MGAGWFFAVWGASGFSVVRRRLFGVPRFGEWLLPELAMYHGFRNVKDLIEQFVVWHDFGALGWIPEQKVHQELMPLDDYIDQTMLRHLKVELPIPEREKPTAEPLRAHGFRKAPVESWEAEYMRNLERMKDEGR